MKIETQIQKLMGFSKSISERVVYSDKHVSTLRKKKTLKQPNFTSQGNRKGRTNLVDGEK